MLSMCSDALVLLVQQNNHSAGSLQEQLVAMITLYWNTIVGLLW